MMPIQTGPNSRSQGRPTPIADRVAKVFPNLNRDRSDLVQASGRDLWAESARPKLAPNPNPEMVARYEDGGSDPDASVLPVSLQISTRPDGISAQPQPDPRMTDSSAYTAPPQAGSAPPSYQGPGYYPVPGGTATPAPGWYGPTPFASPNVVPVAPAGNSAAQPAAMNQQVQLVAFVNDPRVQGGMIQAGPQYPEQIQLPSLAANADPQVSGPPPARMVYSTPAGAPAQASDLAPEPPPAPRMASTAPQPPGTSAPTSVPSTVSSSAPPPPVGPRSV